MLYNDQFNCVPGAKIMTSTSGFTDVSSLPERPIGNHIVTYARHHVIASEVFNDSPFLKALQANGLWNQSSFNYGDSPLNSH